MRVCSVDGCDRKHYGRGLCGIHWQRQRAHGDVNTLLRAPNGSGWENQYGYRFNGDKREHIIVAEKALGRPLPPGAEIHHLNEVKSDNRPENLVICPDRVYHYLLHVRTRALRECGNPNFRKCPLCGVYDDPALMQRRTPLRFAREAYRHRECHARYERERKRQRKVSQ